MKKTPVIAFAFILFAGMLVTQSMSFGKPEYTKTEKKPCTACHVTAKSKDLNPVGTCYKEKKNLKDCAK